MSKGDESLGIKELLCPMCLDVFDGRFAEVEQAMEKGEGRQAKDIYQMEHEAQQMELQIQESLPSERRAECWLLVASVQALAEVRTKRVVNGWAEQGMLYNILMTEAWKAAKSYDPAKSAKFSTWVFRPWQYVISNFRRVKRLQTESLSTSSHDDPDKKILEEIEDRNQLRPDELISMEEFAGKIATTDYLTLEALIGDVRHEHEWLCPYCRRIIREQILTGTNTAPEDLPTWNYKKYLSTLDVYARRKLWINEIN